MLRMDYQPIQQGIATLMPPVESAPFSDDGPRRFDRSLLIETALAIIVAVLAIKFIGASSASGAAWLMIPGTLIVAAFVPTAVKGRRFPEFGFHIRQMKKSLVVLGWTCVAFFPLTFCGLWLLRICELELPLRLVLPQGQDWVYWLLYQFLCIAIAEEVFFRGYVQSNILRLTNPMVGKLPRLQQWLSIVISAACFAGVHIIVQGQIISVLTFLPGVVLGWLFIRTRSLLAPILFHGLANAWYLVMATVFM